MSNPIDENISAILEDDDKIERLDHVMLVFDDEPAPTEPLAPAPALVLPRPTPVTEIPRWTLRPAPRRSPNPLAPEMLL